MGEYVEEAFGAPWSFSCKQSAIGGRLVAAADQVNKRYRMFDRGIRAGGRWPYAFNGTYLQHRAYAVV